jgi:hypothetical protein
MNDPITLVGTVLRSARQAVDKIKAARAEIEALDQKISEASADLRSQKLARQAELAKAEAHLLEVAGLGDEAGTFRIVDPEVKVSINATFGIKPANIPAASAALASEVGSDLVNIAIPSKPEFSKSGFNSLLKMKPEVVTWFNQFVETKLSNPKIEI